jgi:hypothetical protein
MSSKPETLQQEHKQPDHKIGTRQRLKHFTFAWFLSTMSTGGLALALAETPHQFPGNSSPPPNIPITPPFSAARTNTNPPNHRPLPHRPHRLLPKHPTLPRIMHLHGPPAILPPHALPILLRPRARIPLPRFLLAQPKRNPSRDPKLRHHPRSYRVPLAHRRCLRLVLDVCCVFACKRRVPVLGSHGV